MGGARRLRKAATKGREAGMWGLWGGGVGRGGEEPRQAKELPMHLMGMYVTVSSHMGKSLGVYC